MEETKEMRTTFWAAKDTLQAATGLAFPKPQAELAFMVDASRCEAYWKWTSSDPCRPLGVAGLIL